MQPQQLLSIPFPRAEPRFMIQRPGQSLRPQSSPQHSRSAAAPRPAARGCRNAPPKHLPWLARQFLTP
jgi:hypothetical protein